MWQNKFLLMNLSQISTRTEFHCQQGELIITDIQSWRYISSRHKVRVMEPLHDLYLLLPTLSVTGIQFQTTPFQSNLFLCNLQHDHRYIMTWTNQNWNWLFQYDTYDIVHGITLVMFHVLHGNGIPYRNWLQWLIILDPFLCLNLT